MPRSKRNRVVPLTKVSKKGKPLKDKNIELVREQLDKYKNLFVFSYSHMRTNPLKDMKNDWADSRFFFGKNKVVQVALGKTPETEYKDDVHKVTTKLSGTKGILFTNQTKKDVLTYFNTFSEPQFAISGDVATRTVTLDAGDLPFPSQMDTRLRQLGLYTTLKKGVISLEKDFIVCKEGDIITTESARLLELMDIKMGEFKMDIVCSYNEKSGFEDLKPDEVKISNRQLKKLKELNKKKTSKVKDTTSIEQEEGDVEVEEEEEEEEEPEMEIN